MHLFYLCTIFKENLEDEYEPRRRDHISHFILRLAYCQSWVYIYSFVVNSVVLGYKLVHRKLTRTVLNIGNLRRTSETSGSWVEYHCSELFETSRLLKNNGKILLQILPVETLLDFMGDTLYSGFKIGGNFIKEKDFWYFFSKNKWCKNQIHTQIWYRFLEVELYGLVSIRLRCVP